MVPNKSSKPAEEIKEVFEDAEEDSNPDNSKDLKRKKTIDLL